MVVDIPDGGLVLESSAKGMAGLSMQTFAITLSDDMIEDMINCVQNGQEIQLSLGGSPVSLVSACDLLFSALSPHCGGCMGQWHPFHNELFTNGSIALVTASFLIVSAVNRTRHTPHHFSI